MPATVTVKCERCKQPFTARVADRKRGWGRFCSKSCKAIKQEQRTGQHANYLHRRDRPYRDDDGSFTMSAEELSYGGYGDADVNTPFGEGKW